MVIDLTFFQTIDPRVITIVVASIIGLFSILVLFFFIKIFFWFYLPTKQKKYVDSFDYTFLAIDIPKENYQSPKAVESIFTSLMGSYAGPTKKDHYFQGVVQLPFSFEIVSIEGYIQFLVRTPVIFRDLVEAAVFSQYPNAQIIEVEDYVPSVPQKWPDENYKFWGAELAMIQDDMYPIKTYPFFEHSLSQELKDPMANLLEAMSRLGPGEQSWIQIVVVASLPTWREKGIKIVKKLTGDKYNPKKTFMEKLTDPLLNIFGFAADVIVARAEGGMSEPAAPVDANKVMNLTPGERSIIEAIQIKISKIGFFTKIRFAYIAEKPVFNAARGVSGFFGAFSQFNSVDLNGFKPHAKNKTTAAYFFVKSRVKRRQNNLMREYRERIGVTGGLSKPYVLNIEELATLWHFPDIAVKAPLVQKTEAKRAEPPVKLPSEFEEAVEVEDNFGTNEDSFGSTENGKPEEVMNAEFNLDLSSTHFEERFAKDKAQVQERIREEQETKPPTPPPDENSGGTPDNLPV